MTNGQELMRLLSEQAKAINAQNDREATYIQKSLRARFADVICVTCGHQAIRHIALTPELPAGTRCGGVEMKDEDCACPGLQFGRRSQPVTIRRVIGERPEDVPGDWLIFNAPRPLPGTRYWQGEWCHGVFYSAVDPHDRYAADLIEGCADLDGWLIQHVTMEDAREWAYYYAEESGYLTREEVDKEEDQEIADWYLTHKGRVRGEIVADSIAGWRVVALDVLTERVQRVKKLLDEGEPGAALVLLQGIRSDIPQRATWDAKKAAEAIEGGDPYTDGDLRLDAILEKIGEAVLQ